jgi:hypothetical protein
LEILVLHLDLICFWNSFDKKKISATIASFYKKILNVCEYLVVYRHTHTISTTAIVESLAPQVLSWQLDLKICHILHYCILACLLEQKEGSYFAFLETIYPTTSCNIPNDLNLHQHIYDKLKTQCDPLYPEPLYYPVI